MQYSDKNLFVISKESIKFAMAEEPVDVNVNGVLSN